MSFTPFPLISWYPRLLPLHLQCPPNKRKQTNKKWTNKQTKNPQLVCSQGIPAGVRGLDTGMIWGKEGWRKSVCDSLEMGSERKERLQWGSCYRMRDETGWVLVLRSSRRPMGLPSAYLLAWQELPFISKGCLWRLEPWKKQQVVGGELLKIHKIW